MAERWTADTRGLVAKTDAEHMLDGDLTCACGWEPWEDPEVVAPDGEPGESEMLQWMAHHADALLSALADRGLLVEPGSETRVEWAYQVAGHAEPWGHTRYRYRAEERLSAYLEQMPAGQAHLVRRNIYTAPWRPVDASGDTP